MRICTVLALLLAACRSPATGPSLPIEAVAGRSVQDRPIHYWVFGKSGPVIWYVASIHGNETAGTPLLKDLMLFLFTRPHELAGRRAVVVPLANPDGVERNRRGNANGVDLNRDFDNFTQPETRALRALLRRYPPARIVSLHQPLSCVDYDGPAEPLARRMAATCGLPVRKLGTRPGSLGQYCEARRIPLITLEMRRSDDRLSDARLSRRYGPALLVALTGVK